MKFGRAWRPDAGEDFRLMGQENQLWREIMGRAASKRHDQLVEYVARHLKQRFYDDIRAHTDGFRPPVKVENGQEHPTFAPDVTMLAKRSGLNVLEVETPETLENGDTAHRWQTLSRHAERNGGRFWVVVPQGVRETAMSKLRSLDVQARVWEVGAEEF